jgi:hypothetical protein
MTIIRIDDDNIELDEKYIHFSPYLSAGLSFAKMRKENVVDLATQTRMNEDTEEYIVHDRKVIDNYLSFIQGGEFTMEEDDEAFFEYMGHPNSCGYPLEYWRLKLRSRWIRHNFYRLNLAQRDGGMYGLVEIPIVNMIDITGTYRKAKLLRNPEVETDRTVIAGGAALFSSGLSTSMNDIDLFSLDRDRSLKYCEIFGREGRMITSNSYNYKALCTITGPTHDPGSSRCLKKISLIARQYTCISEIVHGFDLDASQFVLVCTEGIQKLYTTEIGLYSASKGQQYYDPDLASTTYIERLNKYKSRGISAILPMIERGDIVETIHGIRTSLYLSSLFVGNALYNTDVIRSLLIRNKMPRDIGTILIVMSFFSIPSAMLRMLLHNGRSIPRYDRTRDTGMIEWIMDNPMRQDVLTGSIYPTQEETPMESYMKSPLYIHSGIDVPNDVSDQYPIPVVPERYRRGMSARAQSDTHNVIVRGLPDLSLRGVLQELGIENYPISDDEGRDYESE